MARFALCALSLAALVFPAALLAHAGAPYRTVPAAERYVRTAKIKLPDGSTVRAWRVDCSGRGTGRNSTFQHFICIVMPRRERGFWLPVHTLPNGRGWAYARPLGM
jgi:hypothetical protein